jgi:hypothetical protein
MTQALYAHMNNKTIKKKKEKMIDVIGQCLRVLCVAGNLSVLSSQRLKKSLVVSRH